MIFIDWWIMVFLVEWFVLWPKLLCESYAMDHFGHH